MEDAGQSVESSNSAWSEVARLRESVRISCFMVIVRRVMDGISVAGEGVVVLASRYVVP